MKKAGGQAFHPPVRKCVLREPLFKIPCRGQSYIQWCHVPEIWVLLKCCIKIFNWTRCLPPCAARFCRFAFRTLSESDNRLPTDLLNHVTK